MNWSGAVRYSMDQENKVNKMFIISLGNLTELESTTKSSALYFIQTAKSTNVRSTWEM
mgnify:CR=1 FL=1